MSITNGCFNIKLKIFKNKRKRGERDINQYVKLRKIRSSFITNNSITLLYYLKFRHIHLNVLKLIPKFALTTFGVMPHNYFISKLTIHRNEPVRVI